MAESNPVDENVLKQQAHIKQAKGPQPGEMITGGNQFTQQHHIAAVQAAAASPLSLVGCARPTESRGGLELEGDRDQLASDLDEVVATSGRQGVTR